jgi:hypothetical protein
LSASQQLTAPIAPAPGNRLRAFFVAVSAHKILKLSAIGARHMSEDCSWNRKNGQPDDVRSGSERDAGFRARWVRSTERPFPVISANADHSTRTHVAASKPRRDILRGLIAVGALALGLLQAPDASADSASCLAKVSAYVVELDELLSKERNWVTPYFDLVKRTFPICDCEVDELLNIVRGSRYIRSISYSSRLNEYLIVFSSDVAQADFTYLVSLKKSDSASAGFIDK